MLSSTIAQAKLNGTVRSIEYAIST